MLNRKQFIQIAGGGLLSLAAPRFIEAASDSNRFHFAVIADTHIIDRFYKGPERTTEDTESLRRSAERLARTRSAIGALRPKVEQVFLVGDFFHDYPSEDIDFYYQNATRIDHAKELIDGFSMPVHVGFGNHDYWVPKLSREASHELFRRKLNTRPYYSVEHNGWKFIHLNNFLGATWQAGHERFNKSVGSLGEEQLNWLEAELAQQKPSFVFVHFPLMLIAPTERSDYGLYPILKRHRDTIQRVISGHWHKWFEFGRSYGPQHLVIASTRYDENAFLVVSVDRKKATHELMNLHLVDWNTHYSKPYHST